MVVDVDFPVNKHGRAEVLANAILANIEEEEALRRNKCRCVGLCDGDKEDLEAEFLEKEKLLNFGPFCYTLCQVERIHYDKDAPYYTVRRLDNNEVCKSDGVISGDMIPVNVPVGGRTPSAFAATPLSPKASVFLEARDKSPFSFAFAAATSTSVQELYAKSPSVSLLTSKKPKYANCNRFRTAMSNVKGSFHRCMVRNRPGMYRFRRKLKGFVSGESPFSLQITFVNIVTLAGVYLFLIDPISLLFVPASADSAVFAFTTISFILLVAELLMECFSRPRIYRSLIKSQYAYYPMTATFINNIYIVLEAAALAMVFCEILVSYGNMNINRFMPTDNPDFGLGYSNNIFNVGFLDYV